jgi:hypothetical protein
MMLDKQKWVDFLNWLRQKQGLTNNVEVRHADVSVLGKIRVEREKKKRKIP